jgi:hypothetical protein
MYLLMKPRLLLRNARITRGARFFAVAQNDRDAASALCPIARLPDCPGVGWWRGVCPSARLPVCPVVAGTRGESC